MNILLSTTIHQLLVTAAVILLFIFILKFTIKITIEI